MDSIEFDRNMNDLANNYELMERAVKRLGILLVDDHGYLLGGRPSQCIDLMRKLLLFTSTVVAKQMLLRGCPSHAPDKRVVISAFDIIREKLKYSPTITVDQFCKEGFAPHKMLVLAKAAEYVQWADNKTFCRGGPANKITYVVPPDSISPTITGAEYQHASPSGGGGGGRLSSSPDASVRIGRSYNPNQFSALASAAGIDATAGAGATDGQWQLTDFIKANIMDRRASPSASPATAAAGTARRPQQPSSSSSKSPLPKFSTRTPSARSESRDAADGFEAPEILKAPSYDRQGRPVVHHPIRLRDSSLNNTAATATTTTTTSMSPSKAHAGVQPSTRMRSRAQAAANAAASADAGIARSSSGIISSASQRLDSGAADDGDELSGGFGGGGDDGDDDEAGADGHDPIMGYRPMRPSPSRSSSQRRLLPQDDAGSGDDGAGAAGAGISRREPGLRPESQLSSEIDSLIESRLREHFDRLQLQQTQSGGGGGGGGGGGVGGGDVANTDADLPAEERLADIVERRLQQYIQSPAFLRLVDDRLVKRLQDQAAVEENVDSAMRKVTQKYDFVINKLVGAVDAEFTLLTNRVKMLEMEMQGAHMHTEDGYDDGDYDGSAFSADADAGDASEGGEADHLRGEEILDGFSNEEYIKS